MSRSARGVRRAAAAPLVVAGLLLACVSCTGSSDSGEADGVPDVNGKNQSSPSAPPGKYRTLPEPCGAVPDNVLPKLLPGTGSESPSDEESQVPDASDSSGGQATLTYDTDRRVGCEWSAEGDTWNRRLHVDFERVVSYDPSVSDEEQAQVDYLQAAVRADVPAEVKSSAVPGADRKGSPRARSGSGGTSDATKAKARAGDTTAEDAGKAPKSSSAPSSGTASPRVVSGIGDEAFLEDRVRAEAAEPHREVTIVFRKENVLVTIALREWPLVDGRAQSGSSMQVGAHLLAQELAKQLGEE